MDLDEHLFGVEKGALHGLTMSWGIAPDGSDQHVTLVLQWESRRASTWMALIPEDQQIGHYIGIAMPLLINGYWLGKMRAHNECKRILLKWRESGADVSVRGTAIR